MNESLLKSKTIIVRYGKRKAARKKFLRPCSYKDCNETAYRIKGATFTCFKHKKLANQKRARYNKRQAYLTKFLETEIKKMIKDGRFDKFINKAVKDYFDGK